MTEIRIPQKEKLIMAMLRAPQGDRQEIIKKLTEQFGSVDFDTGEFDFGHTDYYEEEMGKGLKRSILSFERLVDPTMLADAKVFTNNLEKAFYQYETTKRQFNLDPGLLSLSKLVLASAKNFGHRLYLGQGVYAELTLKYATKVGYEPLEWTFPDYASPRYREIMAKIREIYKKQL